MSKTGKLESPALGLFRVLKSDERTVVIQRNQDVERFNADRITYATSPENAPAPDAVAPISNEIDKNAEGPTYIVDRLLEHRVKPDVTLDFRVKWYGYSEQTWEPRETSRRNSFRDTSRRNAASRRQCNRHGATITNEPHPETSTV